MTGSRRPPDPKLRGFTYIIQEPGEEEKKIDSSLKNLSFEEKKKTGANSLYV